MLSYITSLNQNAVKNIIVIAETFIVQLLFIVAMIYCFILVFIFK